MTHENRTVTYWTAGTTAALILVVLIAWWAGLFETMPK
jgi:hypothetical protein